MKKETGRTLDMASLATAIVSVSAMVMIGVLVQALMWRRTFDTRFERDSVPEPSQERSDGPNAPTSAEKTPAAPGAKPVPQKPREPQSGRTLTA